LKVLVEDGLAIGDPVPPIARAIGFCLLAMCIQCDQFQDIKEQQTNKSTTSLDGKQSKTVVRAIIFQINNAEKSRIAGLT